MHYCEFQPAPLLAPYIRCYWILRASTNPFAAPERLIPDGAVELLFNYGDPYRRTNSTGQSELVKGSHLVGPREHYYLIEQLGAIDHVSVRFAPGGFHRLFGIPLPDLTNQVYTVDLIWGPLLQPLEQQLYTAPDDIARCAILDNFLLQRLNQSTLDSALISVAQGHLRQYPSGLSIRALAAVSHCSPRTLERAFPTWTGYTPKQYSQIMRFLNLLNTLHQSPTPTWTALAQDFGYYDQSHMVKDFQRYSGISPTQYIAQTHWIASQVAAQGSAQNSELAAASTP